MSRLNVFVNVRLNVFVNVAFECLYECHYECRECHVCMNCQGTEGEGETAIAPYPELFVFHDCRLPLSLYPPTPPTPSPPKGVQVNDENVRIFYSFSRVRGFGSYSSVRGITVKEISEKLSALYELLLVS
jgi:hypothetical protein